MSLFLELKTALVKVRHALVGLEYLQITEEVLYKCSLCSKQWNLQAIIGHFESLSHRLKFLKAHFPSVFGAIRLDLFKDKQNKLGQLLEKLCSEVEIRLGRLPPTFLTGDPAFDAAQLSEIAHFEEEPSSTLVIDLILMIQAAQMSGHRSRSPLRIWESHERSSSRHSRDDSGRSQRHKDDYNTDYLLKSHRIRRQYLDYYHDLNSHPDYTETWNSFWISNAREYEAAEKDPKGSDFTQHWKHFWDHRLVLKEEEDVLKMRVRLRKLLNLALEPRDQKIYRRMKKESKKRPTVASGYRVSSGDSSSQVELDYSPPAKKKKASISVTTEAEVPQRISESTSNSSEASASKPPSEEEGNDLSNGELVFLFSNYKDLYDNEKQELKAFMEKLKKTDPERCEVIESFTGGALGTENQ